MPDGSAPSKSAEIIAALFDSLVQAPERFAAADRELCAALERQEIFFGDTLLPTYVTPFLVPAAQLDVLVAKSCEFAEVVEELVQGAMTDERLLATLQPDPARREWIRVDPGYRRITTLSRPDALLDGESIWFVEFNCDSPAMMRFSDVVTGALLDLPLLAPLRARVRPQLMTQALLDLLLASYREFGGAGTPTIAITDWEGQKTKYEHRSLARAFEALGCPTIVCDPRAFRRQGRYLEAQGRRIELIYRRALLGELLERQSEVQALLGAYREGAVCMVNSLRSAVASSKFLLTLIGDRVPTVPRTARISPDHIDALGRVPRKAVLKRAESHGGHDVCLPELATDAEWHQALEDARSSCWVQQDYVPVPTLEVPVRSEGGVARVRKCYNWNPFLFGGRCVGSIVRTSDTPLISITRGGGIMPTWGLK